MSAVSEQYSLLTWKSSGPTIVRISVSPSQPGQYFLCSSMNCTALSTASCFDFNSNWAYPPIISLASVKGPSTTAIFPPESRTRAPAAVGPSPPPPSIVLPASWAILSMASISAWGGRPDFSLDLTIIMNFIVTSPFILVIWLETALVRPHPNKKPGSVDTSNEVLQNRPPRLPHTFFWSEPFAEVGSMHGEAATSVPQPRPSFGRPHISGELTFTFTDHLEEVLRQLDCLLLRVRPQDGEAADHFF